MEMKRCYKCGRLLPITDFYRHPSMADGHLGKCKECTKQDVRARYLVLSSDESFMEKERERGREKYHRLNYGSRKTEHFLMKCASYPGLKCTKRRMKIKTEAGVELHHWNYNFRDSVIPLPRRLHHRLHSRIRLHNDEGIYYEGATALDTPGKHLDVIRRICTEFGFDFTKIDTQYIKSKDE